MGAEIEKFDPSKLADKVRERIRNSLMDLIPEEQWQKLIEAETKYFFENTTREYSNMHYQKVDVPGGFRELVQKELRDQTTAKLKEFFNSPDWTATWEWNPTFSGYNAKAASEQVKKLVVEHSAEIISAVLSKALQDGVMHMQNALR